MGRDEIKDIEEKYLKFIEQPIEGILYDLNMLPEQLMDNSGPGAEKEWLVMKIIIALKHLLEENSE